MIKRYSTPDMAEIWSDQNKYQKWLDVEIAVCEAWAVEGVVPKKSLNIIKRKAKFNVKKIEKIEKIVKHDVIAFTTNLSEYIGPESRYIHLGLTSSDVLDTAFSLQIKESGLLILKDFEILIKTLIKLSKKYLKTPMIGRSHGIHAEVTTFGLVAANWLDEAKRAKFRLENSIKNCSIGKLSGAVGTYSNISPRIEKRACKILKLNPAPISSQIINRDYYADFFVSLAFIATCIERISIQIRHLQRTEVLEVEEPFSKGQKGSSAMPHKRNPILSENLSGISRYVRSNLAAGFENIPLWHERDISHSSVERIIGPDNCIAVHFMIRRANNLLSGLNVYPKKMMKNIYLTNGIIFSQNILIKLIDKKLSREKSYQIVQRIAHEAWDSNKDFKNLLMNDAEVLKILSPSEINDAFQFDGLISNAKLIFKRVLEK